MADYSRAIATAVRLIAAKGEACTWRKYNVIDGAEEWNEATSGAPTDIPVSIVFLPYERQTASLLAKLAGLTDIERYDLYGLMAPGAFTPSTRDAIISVRGELRPVKIDILQPAEQVILYTLGLAG